MKRESLSVTVIVDSSIDDGSIENRGALFVVVNREVIEHGMSLCPCSVMVSELVVLEVVSLLSFDSVSERVNEERQGTK